MTALPGRPLSVVHARAMKFGNKAADPVDAMHALARIQDKQSLPNNGNTCQSSEIISQRNIPMLIRRHDSPAREF